MKCNLSCDFCFISQEKWDDDKIVYPLEKWKQVFDQVKEMKIPYLTILGGEPLMYPEMFFASRKCSVLQRKMPRHLASKVFVTTEYVPSLA